MQTFGVRSIRMPGTVLSCRTQRARETQGRMLEVSWWLVRHRAGWWRHHGGWWHLRKLVFELVGGVRILAG